ncbi:DEAD/DEAH box helicase domain protein [Anaeromyxobacter dehalogenans 2CP-1]|uniref:DEAD/DEAH box helicase domain protein n=1 Tax=Anaeromyxobacter dehalogenans (strain ATCC BAA-258 / DSM 21875 / 2CP-1) TaxID=455488 RepID=B8JFR7_ANAD2|nr:DEAD/DEAH box helicase [Anaeromyxobacter dehalogenans]ACL64505.1 DEAD/DEAH box helicase domain protein [Anaeromyxobacter dehalogenans 2CP-1]
MSAFSRFPARLQQAIVSRLGWTALRAVQELAGEAILDGKNAVVLAPTAGGKTEASIFPALANLVENGCEGVGVVYVAPIKALLNNQEERLGTYTEMVGLRRFVWHGDVPDRDKREFVREPAELLMTTPESLEVMLLSPRFPTPKVFPDLRMVIVDEVHAFAGTERGAHLMSVLERLIKSTKNDVQRIGLSATVGNPEEILGWLQGTSRRAGVVVDPPKVSARRELHVSLHESVIDIARDAARRAAGNKSLFFCQSRALTESVAERMRGHGTEVFVHHGSVSREERHDAEAQFNHGTNACIVCTSTLELGIDVGDLDLVMQANAPSTVSSFLQRMGRTGRRAGQTANTSFFCEDEDAALQAVALVELAREGWVERVPAARRCWPVFAHQIFALTLQYGAVSPERCWEHLHVVRDFADISRDEFERVLDHMKRHEYLFESGGLLSLGQKAERVYGKRNFLELYAVFSSPVLYQVETAAGRALGSLEQNFVDQLVEEMSAFLLAGRAWLVEHVHHEDRVVRVREAPRGQKPSWGGFAPSLLGFEICQRMKRVLTDSTPVPYADAAAMRAIEARRKDLGDTLRRPIAMQTDEGVVRWWTFAGGKINQTLKYGLEWSHDWSVKGDNFELRISGAGVSDGAVREAIREVSSAAFWDKPETRSAILGRLPAYRLSKFQDALPDVFAVELVGNYLLDVPRAQAFAQSVL